MTEADASTTGGARAAGRRFAAGGDRSGRGGGEGPPMLDSEGGRVQRALNWLEALLEDRRIEIGLISGLFLALALFTAVRPMYPNYDTSYALVWGDQIAHGQLPDYNVFRTPTPHPLFNLYTALLSLTGNAAIQILLYLSLAMYAALLAGIYRMVQLKVGTLVAFFSVLVLLTRSDLIAFALRSMLDIPFLGLIIWAAVLELKRPRRGSAPLVLLALAGLLRPEAWILAGMYWLWLALGMVRPRMSLPGTTPSAAQLTYFAGLVAIAPLLWLGFDWIVTGEPLYSVTSTREVAGEFNRQKSLPQAIWLLPRLVGGSEQIVNGVAGALGLGMAVYMLRARMLMLVGLALTGVFTYLMIAAAGLSVISRYLVIPSLVMCIGVAFALVGWVQLSGNARRAGITIAIVALALIAYRAPSYVYEARELNTKTLQTSVRFSRIYKILERPANIGKVKSCLPIIAPTHEVVPVIRYRFGLDKARIVASDQLTSRPRAGSLMIPTSGLDPLGLTVVDHLLRKPWTALPQPGFEFLSENRAWILYTSCGGRR